MTPEELKKYDYIPMQLKASVGFSYNHGVDLYIWKANVKKDENDALRIQLAEENEAINLEDIDFILRKYWEENNVDWTGVKACLIPSEVPSYSAKHELNGRAWIKNPPWVKNKGQLINANGQPVTPQYSSSYIGDVLTFLQNNPEEKELLFVSFQSFTEGFIGWIKKKTSEKPKTKYVMLKNENILVSNLTAEDE